MRGVSIPAALRSLAESVAPLAIPRVDGLDHPADDAGPSDRGEMGGKRKKAPHERAGWREMDEQGLLKRRATGGRKKQTIEEYVGYVPHEPTMPPGAGNGAGGAGAAGGEANGSGSGSGQPGSLAGALSSHGMAGDDMDGAGYKRHHSNEAMWANPAESKRQQK
jgi:hypothetical protein